MRYEVNISSTDLQTVEDMIFGDVRGSAEMYIDDVSAALASAYGERVTPYYKNHTAFMEADSKTILIGNYTYSAGGRWRPAYCAPKWKVSCRIMRNILCSI